ATAVPLQRPTSVVKAVVLHLRQVAMRNPSCVPQPAVLTQTSTPRTFQLRHPAHVTARLRSIRVRERLLRRAVLNPDQLTPKRFIDRWLERCCSAGDSSNSGRLTDNTGGWTRCARVQSFRHAP